MGSQRNILWLGPAALREVTVEGEGEGEGNQDPLEMAQDRSSYF